MEMQKVLHLKDAKKKKSFHLHDDYAIMEKKDGWYMTIDYLDGHWGSLRSSAGREIPSMFDISGLFQGIKTLTGNYRFILEATVPGVPFEIANGVFNRKYEQVEVCKLHIHDAIPLGSLAMPFQQRYGLLQGPLMRYLEDVLGHYIELVPILDITNEEEKLYFHFENLVQEGAEGIVAKRLEAGYSPGKRNADMLKLKSEVTIDAEVIKYFWSTGEKGNDALNLLVRSPETGEFTVVVNRHSAIDKIVTMPQVAGQIVEVKAMDILPSGKPRQPVFKHIRWDK